MILSRFWYALLAVSLSFVLFVLYLATSVSNRSSHKTTGQLLTAASKAVRWYLTDDASNRAAALIPLAADPKVSSVLKKASGGENDDGLKSEATRKIRSYRESNAGGVVFDEIAAVDIHGRVIAQDNMKVGQSEGFELGGYPVVADALHGYIRDDSWVLNGQIYRVVARPVEVAAGSAPVGAIVGIKRMDDAYARQISEATGAAVAFFADTQRVSSGSPPDFNAALLETRNEHFAKLEADENYRDKGRTAPFLFNRVTNKEAIAIFAKLPGDAWDLGGGYLVAHAEAIVESPFDFQTLALEDDKKQVPFVMIVLIATAAVLLGLAFSVVEHTVPLMGFKKALADLADKKSDTDVLKPSTFRGNFKTMAALINDALDKIASKSGVDRGTADLESVLGDLEKAPAMSAFSVPDAPAAPSANAGRPKSVPRPKKALPKGSSPGKPPPPPSSKGRSSGIADEASGLDDPSSLDERRASNEPSGFDEPSVLDEPSVFDDNFDEEADWRNVYDAFVAMKTKCGEDTERLTYDKFRGTLQRNKDALMARHRCDRVKFTVYEKQGKAALKASPVRS